MTGGGSQTKESPEGSPPVHISAGARRNTEKREGEEKEESESHLLLAAVPAARFSLAVV